MVDTIDVHDLPEEQASLIQEFVEFLKRKLKTKEAIKEREEIPSINPGVLLKHAGIISIGGDAVKEAEYYEE